MAFSYSAVILVILRLYQGRYEIECGTAALDVPFQYISTCVRMKTAVSDILSFIVRSASYANLQLPRCQKVMLASCIDQFDLINCGAAVTFCDNELSTGMWASGPSAVFVTCMRLSKNDLFLGRNVYDISKVGSDGYELYLRLIEIFHPSDVCWR